MTIVAEGTRGSNLLASEIRTRSGRQVGSSDRGVRSEELGRRPACPVDRNYGLTLPDLFASRQLVALTTFSDLVREARARVYRDAVSAGLADDREGPTAVTGSASAYADGVATYLGLALDKAADYWSTICFWHNGGAHQKELR